MIIENSKTDYVIFEAANSLKEAIIREWSMLNTDDVTSLWQYLLRHVINNAGMAVFVREKMLQVRGFLLKDNLNNFKITLRLTIRCLIFNV